MSYVWRLTNGPCNIRTIKQKAIQNSFWTLSDKLSIACVISARDGTVISEVWPIRFTRILIVPQL